MLKFWGIVVFLKQIWMGALSVANSAELAEETVDSVEVVEETVDDLVKRCAMPCFGCLLLYGQLYILPSSPTTDDSMRQTCPSEYQIIYTRHIAIQCTLGTLSRWREYEQ